MQMYQGSNAYGMTRGELDGAAHRGEYKRQDRGSATKMNWAQPLDNNEFRANGHRRPSSDGSLRAPGAARPSGKAVPNGGPDVGRYQGTGGWANGGAGSRSQRNSWEWGASTGRHVDSHGWRQRPHRAPRSGAAAGGRQASGGGQAGGSSKPAVPPSQPTYTATPAQEPTANLDSSQGPPMPVILSGLPPALCSKMCMEAVLEQAGLEGAVMAVEMSPGGDAILHLSSWSAATQCLAHFNGCRWDATGPPVRASLAVVEVQAVPVTPQVAAAPPPKFHQQALPLESMAMDKGSSSASLDVEHEDSTVAGSPLSTDDSSYDTDDGF